MSQHIFDGSDYKPSRDNDRLTNQLQKIWAIVKNGKWFTLRDISKATGYTEASISAQLRHLWKDRLGLHEIEKNHLGNGLYEYRVIENKHSNGCVDLGKRSVKRG